MTISRVQFRWLAVGALPFLSCAALAGDQQERLSVEWIYSEEGKRASAEPSHFWLDDGRILIHDEQDPEEERTIQIFDPGRGVLEPLVDRKRALASLTELTEPEEPLEELELPDSFDPKGRYAAYVIEDDLFLLDLKTSRFARVAETEAEETSPRFSPDGRTLAFVRDHDLHLYDLKKGEERRLTRDGSETLLNGTLSWVYWEEIFSRTDRGYWWSPDSKSIAFLQTDESPVGEMLFVDFEPYQPEVIRQRYPKAGSAIPRVRAGVIDLETSKTTWVDLGAYPYAYLVRIAWLPDSSRLSVQTLDRQQTTLDLFLADAKTGGVTHLLRETAGGWINLNDDLRFLGDGERFLWVSERDGFAHLYLYAMDGRLIHQVTRGDWALRACASGAFREQHALAAVDEEEGWIYFTALEKSSIEMHLYRIRFDGSDMARLTREEGVHAISFGPRERRYLDLHSDIATRPALDLYRADGQRSKTVVPPRGELIERFALHAPELLTIPAADGFPMPAQILRPDGFDPDRKYPAILYVYGGPSAPTVSNSWSSRDYFEHVLASEGFVVLRVDNRTATARSKTLEDLILHDGYGERELSDLLDAVRWVKSQPFVDPERVGIWGWSGGGTFTLLAMTRSQEFRAGISVAPVTDWRHYDAVWAEAFMKRPEDNPEGYDRTSLVNRAKDLHGRLLLVHGTYDDNVHPQNTWAFADQLIESGTLFDLMIYPMRKHDIADDPAQTHLYRTMLEFWKRNL